MLNLIKHWPGINKIYLYFKDRKKCRKNLKYCSYLMIWLLILCMHNWKGLAILLSIFLLTHIFICVDVSFCILMVHKLFKIKALFLFSLNMNWFQLPKYTLNNRELIFLGLPYFLEFHFSCYLWNRSDMFIVCINLIYRVLIKV